MQPIDLPLLLVSRAATAGAEAETYPLDRIRMQKAVFLLTQRGSREWRTLYSYEPYDWGPYSRQLTRDLGYLTQRRLLDVEQFRGSRFGRYVTTISGEESARREWNKLDYRERKFIQAVRAYVTSRSFGKLLREVYAAYPRYATKSKFST